MATTDTESKDNQLIGVLPTLHHRTFNEYLSDSSIGLKILWYYHMGHNMLPYPFIYQVMIEKEYSANKKQSSDIHIGDCTYYIDFQCNPFVQKRVNMDIIPLIEENIETKVRRIEYGEFIDCNNPIHLTSKEAAQLSQDTQAPNNPGCKVISDSFKWWKSTNPLSFKLSQEPDKKRIKST